LSPQIWRVVLALRTTWAADSQTKESKGVFISQIRTNGVRH
jgi:hypothetical protein